VAFDVGQPLEGFLLGVVVFHFLLLYPTPPGGVFCPNSNITRWGCQYNK
jgi:hypothetical protein